MRSHVKIAATAAAVAAALAACGGDDGGAGPSGGPGTPGAIVVEGRDSLAFDPDEITADAGEVTFELRNAGSLQHTFVIEDVEGLRLVTNSRGDVDSGSIELEAGTYTFYCDVAGHRSGGMEGELTIQ